MINFYGLQMMLCYLKVTAIGNAADKSVLWYYSMFYIDEYARLPYAYDLL